MFQENHWREKRNFRHIESIFTDHFYRLRCRDFAVHPRTHCQREYSRTRSPFQNRPGASFPLAYCGCFPGAVGDFLHPVHGRCRSAFFICSPAFMDGYTFARNRIGQMYPCRFRGVRSACPSGPLFLILSSFTALTQGLTVPTGDSGEACKESPVPIFYQSVASRLFCRPANGFGFPSSQQ